jgi:hypothetical protein
MATIQNVENFIWWLTREGKLVEILTSGSRQIPVIAESIDEYGWPYYNYAFVRADQEPSAGVIKGTAIPEITLHDGKIHEQDKAKVADFVQGFGVDATVAARDLADLAAPQSYCLCAKSIREGTASVRCVTFTKSLGGSMVMWIRDTVHTEPDDLVPIDWSEAKERLPAIEDLEEEIACWLQAHLTYNPQIEGWKR